MLLPVVGEGTGKATVTATEHVTATGTATENVTATGKGMSMAECTTHVSSDTDIGLFLSFLSIFVYLLVTNSSKMENGRKEIICPEVCIPLLFIFWVQVQTPV